MRNPRAAVPVAAAAAIAIIFSSTGCSIIEGLFGEPRDDGGQLTAAANVAPAKSQVGDCVKDALAIPDSVTKIELVPCTDTHNGEVFGKTDSGSTWLESTASTFCLAEFETYFGASYKSTDNPYDATYISPADSSATDKTLICIAYMANGTTSTSSAKGSLA